MNKQRFLKVLKNPGNIKDELSNLQELQANYPYAQSIHVLVALAHKQHNSSEAGSSLNYAAMHVADRYNLKELITSEAARDEDIEETKPAENIDVRDANEAVKRNDNLEDTTENKSIEETTVISAKNQPETDTYTSEGEKDEKVSAAKKLTTELGNKFRESLIQKLEKLQIAKAKWSSANQREKKEQKDIVEKITKTAKSRKTAGKKKEGKKAEKSKKEKSKAQKATKSTNVETKTTETADPDKIKQQQELISRFIEISPSIKAKANKPPIVSSEQEDLSVPSTSFKDNLISENLADILISQGKDDKAIDIYKKLIWKFPQKKAYFAARIEELTKKKG